MIRQAISCDICGTEKKQTNHWFVAYDQEGELRLSGWCSRKRQRPGSKHLCGQTCLHMLLDEFLAHEMAARAQLAKEAPAAADAERPAVEAARPVESPLHEFYEEESSARLIPTPETVAASRPSLPSKPAVQTPLVASKAVYTTPLELRPIPGRPSQEELDSDEQDEAHSYSSRNWRVEAWKRERDRQAHGTDRHSLVAVRKRSIS